MATKKELLHKARELKIKGYSVMNKAELESAIHIKQISNWYEDLLKAPVVAWNEDVNIEDSYCSCFMT